MDSKSWYQSRAVWGGIVSIAFSVAGLFGHDVSGKVDQATVANALVTLGAAVGGVLAIYGRIKATTKIG